jgi:LPXTG-site transpeptidase (sortase) family protein
MSPNFDNFEIRREAKTLPGRLPAGRQGRQAPARVFISASIVMFLLSLSAADSVGFVPCSFDGTCSAAVENVQLSSLPQLGPSMDSGQVSDRPPAVSGVEPERIVIPVIGLDLPVQNPSTRDIDALDVLLQKGPVRYVDSAKLGEEGNVLIFAHSSRLPVVKNQMFRAFNRVSELSLGDTITVTGEDESYIYAVRSVRRGDTSDEIIDLSPKQGTILTLVTCDTLSSKESRWILEAEYVGVL